MKISNKIISIPPYISTSWRNVYSVYTSENGMLVITLADGDAVYIPDLTAEQKTQIFQAHTAYLEEADLHEQPQSNPRREHLATDATNQFGAFMQSILGGDGNNQAFQMNLGSIDNLTSVVQHNQSQAHAPDLPPEVLEKIAGIAKMIAPNDPNVLPKAEPHCNCFHCQIARAMAGIPKEAEEATPKAAEPEIPTEELRFEQWEIEQTGENLYSVVNKLDREEKYSVYLGKPLGCTCGKSGCEHIVAVLQS
ncbi:MAG: hypothetical protein Q8K75_08660 [Chlamydiales bacterium]|nr:hypothetical protein [Chlamydiales bacterium]